MREFPLLAEAGLLIAHVRISGPRSSRVLRLALDTGSTSTMIPATAALAIGLPLGRTHLFRETLTVSGREYVPLAIVPSLRLFDTTLRRVQVACHELPLDSPVNGLLGLDLLTRLGAVIDLRKPSICIRSFRR